MAVRTHTNKTTMFRNCFQCLGLAETDIFERIIETPANISICSIAGKCELCYYILEYLRLHADRMDVTVSIFRKTQLWKRDKNCY